MLRLLKEAKGNILDDEVLINTLNNSKLTAGMIQNRVREAEQTENNINQVWSATHLLSSACIPAVPVLSFDTLSLAFSHTWSYKELQL